MSETILPDCLTTEQRQRAESAINIAQSKILVWCEADDKNQASDELKAALEPFFKAVRYADPVTQAETYQPNPCWICGARVRTGGPFTNRCPDYWNCDDRKHAQTKQSESLAAEPQEVGDAGRGTPEGPVTSECCSPHLHRATTSAGPLDQHQVAEMIYVAAEGWADRTDRRALIDIARECAHEILLGLSVQANGGVSRFALSKAISIIFTCHSPTSTEHQDLVDDFVRELSALGISVDSVPAKDGVTISVDAALRIRERVEKRIGSLTFSLAEVEEWLEAAGIKVSDE